MGKPLFWQEVDFLSSEKLKKIIEKTRERPEKENENILDRDDNGFHLYSEELAEDLEILERLGFLQRDYKDVPAAISRPMAYKYVAIKYLLETLGKGPATFYELMQSVIRDSKVSENACKVWDQVVAKDMDVMAKVDAHTFESMFLIAQKKGSLKELTREKFGIEVENEEMVPYSNYHFVGYLLWTMKKYGSVVRLPDGKYQIKNSKVLEYLKFLYELSPNKTPTKRDHVKSVEYVRIKPTPE